MYQAHFYGIVRAQTEQQHGRKEKYRLLANTLCQLFPFAQGKATLDNNIPLMI